MIPILFVFFLAISFFAFKIDGLHSRYKKILFLFFGAILMIYVAFRDGESVRDYKLYTTFFNNPETFIEPSFTFIAFIIKKYLYGDVILLFIIYAILGVGIKLKAITQLTPLFFLSLLVYLSNFLILHEMTQIRVGIASGILLLCIKPVYERKLTTFLLLCTVAVFFHYSALILFPLWFINGHKRRYLLLILAMPVGLVIYFLNINLILNIPIPFLQDKIAIYQDWQKLGIKGLEKINVFNVLFLLRCGVYYLLLYKYQLLIKSSKYAIILLKIYALSLFALLVFSVMPVVAFRISELLGIVEIILLPMVYYLFKPSIFSKGIVFIVCLAVMVLNIFYNKYIF
ncbi:MAG: EpsG family protein [Ferruginibacter sp.]